MLDVEKAQEILREAFPGLEIRTVRAIEEGWTSLVLDINGELIARFPRASWAAEKLQQESRLLPFVRRAVDLPTPDEQALVAGPDGAPLFQMYGKLPGEMLTPELELRLSTDRLSPQLSGFLTQLHSLDPTVLSSIGRDPGDPQRWLERWVRLSERIEEHVLPRLDPGTRASAQEFIAERLGNELAIFRPALLHGDLVGNILVDAATSTITGIIDWGDAELGDPAYDFTSLKAEYSEPLFEKTIKSYEPRVDEAFRSRVVTYAGLYPLYSALFAREVGRTTLEQKYLEMAARTFAAGR